MARSRCRAASHDIRCGPTRRHGNRQESASLAAPTRCHPPRMRLLRSYRLTPSADVRRSFSGIRSGNPAAIERAARRSSRGPRRISCPTRPRPCFRRGMQNHVSPADPVPSPCRRAGGAWSSRYRRASVVSPSRRCRVPGASVSRRDRVATARARPPRNHAPGLNFLNLSRRRARLRKADPIRIAMLASMAQRHDPTGTSAIRLRAEPQLPQLVGAAPPSAKG